MFTVADHLVTIKKRRKLEAENLPPKLRVPTLRIPQEVDLEDYVSRPEKISCADIAAICQEAGMCLARGWGMGLVPFWYQWILRIDDPEQAQPDMTPNVVNIGKINE